MSDLHHRAGRLLLACLTGLCVTVSAQQDEASQAAKDSESELVLPAAPQPANLLPFYVSPTTTLDFAIDAKSFSITPEGIIRYTMVVTSKTGATNISHEGIRCTTAEKKLYATGKPDGGWSPARRDAWTPIWDAGANRQHAALVKDYFCEGGFVSGKAEVILDRLKRQKTLRKNSTIP